MTATRPPVPVDRLTAVEAATEAAALVGYTGAALTRVAETWAASLTVGRLRRAVAARRRLRRADRLAAAAGWAGYRSARISPQTGTLVVVVDAAAAGIEDDPAIRWATLCDDHDGVVCHPTRALAESNASDPAGWCDGCAAGEPLATP